MANPTCPALCFYSYCTVHHCRFSLLLKQSSENRVESSQELVLPSGFFTPASSTAHLRSTDSIKSSHHTPHTYENRCESKQAQQAMEGGQEQEQARRTYIHILIARLEEPKEQEDIQDSMPDEDVEGLIDYNTLIALVDNNDLPGIKARLSGLRGLPVSDLWKHPKVQQWLLIAAISAASHKHRDVVLSFVKEMGVRVNDNPEGMHLKNGSLVQVTPLFAATMSVHEDLALQLLTIPDQEELHLDRMVRGKFSSS